MNLILWRHAHAGDSLDDPVADLGRRLTDRGRQQAERMAAWLQGRLPEGFVVLSSPAARTRETAAALGVPVELDERLAPGATVADHLAALDRLEGPERLAAHVVLVGHQPALGRLASYLLTGSEADWSIKKGAVWWFSVREREGEKQIVLRAAIPPGLVA